MTTLLILLSCIVAGYLLRHKRLPLPPPKYVSYIVWLLLFFFGVAIGGNHTIVAKLGDFGTQAVVIGVLTTLGSVLAAWLLWRLTSKNNKQ